ncbi:MAG: ABC transporter permease [Pseudonocardiales bacterium]|nr:ABC transporter permease [Pseudonocardiales bacterium]MBV9730024.1 ABC transporter permease [Pseudonocardiales bacterium]
MTTPGAAPGYRVAATLPLRVELVRQLRRRRTVLTVGFLALLPFLLWLAFKVGRDDRNRGGTTLVDLATSSGLNFVVFTLFSTASFLLVVVVALFFGDTVASEASWSSLRYLLAAPVPRGRLLRRKAVVAALLSAFALVLLPAVAMAVGVVAYGAGELVSPTGQSLNFLPAIGRLALAPAYLMLHLAWVAGLALLLSVSTDAPLGAVGGAVMLSILSQILETINALGDLRDYLPTRFNSAWADLLASPIDWTHLASGAFSGLLYATIFSLAAWYRFATKDITS